MRVSNNHDLPTNELKIKLKTFKVSKFLYNTIQSKCIYHRLSIKKTYFFPIFNVLSMYFEVTNAVKKSTLSVLRLNIMCSTVQTADVMK